MFYFKYSLNKISYHLIKFIFNLKNIICELGFESTSTAPSLSSWSFKRINSDIKMPIWEDNESISSDDDSEDEEFAGFEFSSQEIQNSREEYTQEWFD